MGPSETAATALLNTRGGSLIMIVQTYQMDGEVTGALACIGRFFSTDMVSGYNWLTRCICYQKHGRHHVFG